MDSPHSSPLALQAGLGAPDPLNFALAAAFLFLLLHIRMA